MKQNREPDKSLISPAEVEAALAALNAPPNRQDPNADRQARLAAGDLLSNWKDQAKTAVDLGNRQEYIRQALGADTRTDPAFPPTDLELDGYQGDTAILSPTDEGTGLKGQAKTPRGLRSKTHKI